MSKLKVLFFGMGSIGRRHARLIKENFGHDLVAFRSSRDAPDDELVKEQIFDVGDIGRVNPDVAFITNPTNKHVEYAKICAERGINMLIEKPLTDQKNLDELETTIKKNNVHVYTAYCLRFHPVIQWLKDYMRENKPVHVRVCVSSYLPGWRKGRNHLETYSASKEKGGGVILDLSHEIDYLYYLLGKPEGVKVKAGRTSTVTKDAEDYADVLFDIKGVPCNMHLNFLSRLNRREIIMDFSNHTVVGDLLANTISKIGDEEETITLPKKDMYLAQLEYFFNNIQSENYMNDWEESKNVHEVIMEIKEGSK